MHVSLRGRPGSDMFRLAVLTWAIVADAAWAQPQGKVFDPSTANLPAIREMHRLTESDGWALAGVSAILSTRTAGQSWTDITPPLAGGKTIDNVYFLDANHGWGRASRGRR